MNQCQSAINFQSQYVHSLVRSLGLFNHLDIIKPLPAPRIILETFHSTEFVDCLLNPISSLSLSSGFEFDCPIFPALTQYVQIVAGGTYLAAKSLTTKRSKISIHWDGGRHHCNKDSASGFCYVNDIVIGILCLHHVFPKVLYIDIDIHHGDGVSRAFYHSSKTFTVSFHRLEKGFFPGSGFSHEKGEGRGKYHNFNVPLKVGLCGSRFLDIVKRVIPLIVESYRPNAIVLVCGADGLSNDPLISGSSPNDGWCLDVESVALIVSFIKSFELPLLITGSGGYSNVNAARLWAQCTNSALGFPLVKDVPEHDFFMDYSPDFSMQNSHSMVKDENTDEDIDRIVTECIQTLNHNT